MHKLLFCLVAGFSRLGTTAVFNIIGSKYSAVTARYGNSYAVVGSVYRYKVADDYQLVTCLIFAPEGDNALTVIVIGYPLKALPRIINLPKGRIVKIELIQVLGNLKHIAVGVVVHKQPVKLFCIVPLDKLTEFLTHKQTLFARMRHHVCVKRSE